MTSQAERLQREKDKAEAMIAWFKDRELPKEPFKLFPWLLVNDANKHASRSIETLTAYLNTPTSIVFRSAYMRLYNIKKYIEALN